MAGGIGALIAAGDYSPTTANGWLAFCESSCRERSASSGSRTLATDGVEDFDTSEHETYTEEEPNALLPEEVRDVPRGDAGALPAALRDDRPRLRHGPAALVAAAAAPARAEADVLWDERRSCVRRSHTVGDEVMRDDEAEAALRHRLAAGGDGVLRWHVETQLATPEQQESGAPLPVASTGGFRSPSVLNKPFADVGARRSGSASDSRQRALRRTFNDLARAAQVEALVTRSISRSPDRADAAALLDRERGRAARGIAKVIEPLRRRESRHRRWCSRWCARAPRRWCSNTKKPAEGASSNRPFS